MYDLSKLETVDPGLNKRFIGTRFNCRFCGECDKKLFGQKMNAHTFPEALGNKLLFSLDECKSCNNYFSIYEDSLCKAAGPFLTLGGVKGKKGFRQTGRSDSGLYMKHQVEEGKRRLSFRIQEYEGK